MCTPKLEVFPNLLDVFKIKLYALVKILLVYLDRMDIPSGLEPIEKLLRC